MFQGCQGWILGRSKPLFSRAGRKRFAVEVLEDRRLLSLSNPLPAQAAAPFSTPPGSLVAEVARSIDHGTAEIADVASEVESAARAATPFNSRTAPPGHSVRAAAQNRQEPAFAAEANRHSGAAAMNDVSAIEAPRIVAPPPAGSASPGQPSPVTARQSLLSPAMEPVAADDSESGNAASDHLPRSHQFPTSSPASTAPRSNSTTGNGDSFGVVTYTVLSTEPVQRPTRPAPVQQPVALREVAQQHDQPPQASSQTVVVAILAPSHAPPATQPPWVVAFRPPQVVGRAPSISLATLATLGVLANQQAEAAQTDAAGPQGTAAANEQRPGRNQDALPESQMTRRPSMADEEASRQRLDEATLAADDELHAKAAEPQTAQSELPADAPASGGQTSQDAARCAVPGDEVVTAALDEDRLAAVDVDAFFAQAYEMLVENVPGDFAAVDEAFEELLVEIDNLGSELAGSLSQTRISDWISAAALLWAGWEVRRRRGRSKAAAVSLETQCASGTYPDLLGLSPLR